MSIIHETKLKDFIEKLIDVDAESIKNDKAKSEFKSLTRATSDLVLTFPVLCTTGISIDTASMISKAIEKNCVSLLQIYLASIQITNSTDLKDYISRFHKNINISNNITVDDLLSISDKMSTSGSSIRLSESSDLEKDMANINGIAKVSMNENSLADFVCHRTFNGYDTVLENNKEKPYTRGSKDAMKEEFDLVEKMSSNDIKKANELMPTKVTVSFYSTTAEHTLDKGIVGVKGKLYPVDSFEIVQRVSSKYDDTNWVRNLVRASSGEISFFKDFLFGLERAKIDAVNSVKKGNSVKMWKVLERRATKNKTSRWKKNLADCAPITTLVISQEEVEYLKKEYDVNLENRNVAIKLMDEYNLMGLVIVDEPAEYASFIWDEGNNADFETLSFRNLERESDSKNFRKEINLLTKAIR